MVTHAICHLVVQGLYLVPFSVVQLFMLLCVDQFMLLGPLSNFVNELLLCLSEPPYLIIVGVEPLEIVLLFEGLVLDLRRALVQVLYHRVVGYLLMMSG